MVSRLKTAPVRDTRKKTFLIVEDEVVSKNDDIPLSEAYRLDAEDAFPSGSGVEVKEVTNFLDAAKVLYDPNRKVVGAVLDNGNPLVEGGARIGDPKAHESIERHEEGAAGTMLFRFMREGDPGAKAESTLHELKTGEIWQNKNGAIKISESLPEILEKMSPEERIARQEELNKIPVLWHTGDPHPSKIIEVARIEHVDLDHHSRKGITEFERAFGKGNVVKVPYSKMTEDLATGVVGHVDDHTICTGKNKSQVFKFASMVKQRLIKNGEMEMSSVPVGSMSIAQAAQQVRSIPSRPVGSPLPAHEDLDDPELRALIEAHAESFNRDPNQAPDPKVSGGGDIAPLTEFPHLTDHRR